MDIAWSNLARNIFSDKGRCFAYERKLFLSLLSNSNDRVKIF